MNEGRGDIDVFTWLVDVTNIEMTNYVCNCDDWLRVMWVGEDEKVTDCAFPV